jgi:hypothetical protein
MTVQNPLGADDWPGLCQWVLFFQRMQTHAVSLNPKEKEGVDFEGLHGGIKFNYMYLPQVDNIVFIPGPG